MQFIKTGQTSHNFETVIAHDEWEEMKVSIEQNPGREPRLELMLDYDPKNPHRVTMSFAELDQVNQIVVKYQAAQKLLKGETENGSY